MSKDSFSEDLIHYDLKIQEALRGVIQQVLRDVSSRGLPGDHHFYITFRTQAPDVRLSKLFREKYPDEMTIVLQNQFWNLRVSDTFFEVDLSFSGKPESLLVPFKAITGFFDPSVQFGLKFEEHSFENDDENTSSHSAGPAALVAHKLPSAKKGSGTKHRQASDSVHAFKDNALAERSESEGILEDVLAGGSGGMRSAPSNVVSLDLFRKK
jgi:hypothetical protein